MYWLGLGSFIGVGSPVKITQQWKSSLRLGGYMHNSKRSRFSKIQNCYRFFYLGMSWNSITCFLSLISFNWHENIASARSKIIYELDNNLTRIAVFFACPFSRLAVTVYGTLSALYQIVKLYTVEPSCATTPPNKKHIPIFFFSQRSIIFYS